MVCTVGALAVFLRSLHSDFVRHFCIGWHVCPRPVQSHGPSAGPRRHLLHLHLGVRPQPVQAGKILEKYCDETTQFDGAGTSCDARQESNQRKRICLTFDL